ncbi:MAG TPA: HAD family phosphatase [Oligoflexia bacterium]|nr:HAD family phosphatase [Oligoflexia bacterium]HMP49133.1 HAD family phosphatase [Oligoflexia bacterium]
MDGLMLDTQALAHQALKMASKDFGFLLTSPMCDAVRGLNESNTVQYLESYLGITIPEREYISRFHSYYQQLLDINIPIKSGLIELLDFLESYKIPKAIATSTSYDLAIRKLENTNLRDRFPTIVGGDHVERGKPFPDIFILAADKLSINPCSCYVLEDSDAGIEAAFEAGMKPIMVPDGNTPSDESKHRAIKIYASLKDVLDYATRLI